MNNLKRREMLTAALKPDETRNPIKEEKKESTVDILHQQQPYSEKDLPEVMDFVDLESL